MRKLLVLLNLRPRLPGVTSLGRNGVPVLREVAGLEGAGPAAGVGNREAEEKEEGLAVSVAEEIESPPGELVDGVAAVVPAAS